MRDIINKSPEKQKQQEQITKQKNMHKCESYHINVCAYKLLHSYQLKYF